MRRKQYDRNKAVQAENGRQNKFSEAVNAEGDGATMLSAPDLAGRHANAVVMESRELRDMIERERAQFILNDVELGLTFLNVARNTLNQETARRNVANAQRALDMVLHEISKLRASRQEMAEIKAQFDLLSEQLKAFKSRERGSLSNVDAEAAVP